MRISEITRYGTPRKLKNPLSVAHALAADHGLRKERKGGRSEERELHWRMGDSNVPQIKKIAKEFGFIRGGGQVQSKFKIRSAEDRATWVHPDGSRITIQPYNTWRPDREEWEQDERDGYHIDGFGDDYDTFDDELAAWQKEHDKWLKKPTGEVFLYPPKDIDTLHPKYKTPNVPIPNRENLRLIRDKEVKAGDLVYYIPYNQSKVSPATIVSNTRINTNIATRDYPNPIAADRYLNLYYEI